MAEATMWKRWARSEEAKGREVEEKKRKKKKRKVKKRRRVGGKKCRREVDVPKQDQTLGKSGRCLFLLFALGAKLAVCQRCSGRTAEKDGDDGKGCSRGSSSEREQTGGGDSKRWRQPEGEDRTELKKEATYLRCTLLDGSAWSTEEKVHGKMQRKVRCLFFGMEHRLKEEQFNREAIEGWRFAADAARITDETAGSEARKHTPGGFFVAVDSNLGAVVGVKEGAIDSIPGNEARIAPNVRGGMRVFSVCFWHSEVWTPRNEALLETVLKQARTTRHPWLTACDANVGPEDFEKSLFSFIKGSRCMCWLRKKRPRAGRKAQKGEWIDKTYDCVIASVSLLTKDIADGGGGRF